MKDYTNVDWREAASQTAVSDLAREVSILTIILGLVIIGLLIRVGHQTSQIHKLQVQVECLKQPISAVRKWEMCP